MNASYGPCYHGVDYSVPPHGLIETALADASNIVVNEKGLPTGRGGSVRLNNTSLASEVTSFHEYRSGATANQICSYSTKIAVYNSATGEFVDKITGLTDGEMYQWTNFDSKAIGANGADAPQYWTDDSNKGDLAGSPPVGVCVTEWSNRLWFGGDTTNIGRLTGSKLVDPTNYVATGADGYISQAVGDAGDPITGLFGFFDILIVGKKNSLYKVYFGTPNDATTLYIKPVYVKSADSVGFTSKWAITQVGNDVLFLDGFDIKRLSGIEEFGDLETSSVIPHFREYLASIADKDYIQYSQFFHYKKKQQVWVSIPTGASTRYVFILDYRFISTTGRYAVYPMGNLVVNSFGGMLDGSLTNLYYGDRTGYVHQLDTGENDNGSAISRYFTFCFSGNQMDEDNSIKNGHDYRKNFSYSDTYIKPTAATLNLTPSYALDLFDDTQARASGNYTDLSAETVNAWTGTGVKNKRLKLWGINGKTLLVKWTHNTLGQNFVFYPSTMYYTFKSKYIVE